jgi:LCP family protein required for cell wall assembly
MTVIGWVSIAVVSALVIATLAAYVKYREVWDSIHRVAVTDLGRRPPRYTNPKDPNYPNALNLLMFASGSTSGLTRQQQLYWHVGNDTGDAVSETIMIVHISPGRHLVTVVNIPRDTVVPVYGCARGPGWAGQQADPSAIEQIDNTLSYGGPACLWKTIEQQTGIRIDHFIELGYPGLVNLVNDIGGVNVCVPFAVYDSDSGLRLAKGEHHIDGVTFLKFWRTREKTGNGSDLQRIQRDDYLLAQTLKQVLRANLLSSPTRLLKVLGDAAGAMTTDTGLSQSDLLQTAESLRGLSARDYQFIQASNVLYPPNPNWVEFEQPQADALFSAVAHDTTLPRAAGPGRGKGAGGGVPTLDTTRSQPAPSPARSPRAPVSNLAHSYGGITGNVSCVSDSGAFAGPLSPG